MCAHLRPRVLGFGCLSLLAFVRLALATAPSPGWLLAPGSGSGWLWLPRSGSDSWLWLRLVQAFSSAVRFWLPRSAFWPDLARLASVGQWSWVVVVVVVVVVRGLDCTTSQYLKMLVSSFHEWTAEQRCSCATTIIRLEIVVRIFWVS